MLMHHTGLLPYMLPPLCTDPHDIRLVGEAHRCSGELEMKKDEEWRPVVDWISQWNQESATSVCRQLGCGSAVFTQDTDSGLDRPVWWINSSCVRSTSALPDCVIPTSVHENFGGHKVICLGIIGQSSVK